MYTVLRFETVFYKLIEENCKKFCVEISCSNYLLEIVIISQG